MAVQTLPFFTLIKLDRNAQLPIFRQLSGGLLNLIRNGKLKHGYQLPSSREMALLMKLNRTTVVAAYDELVVQGWLEVVARKGVFVSKRLPLINPRLFKPTTEDFIFHSGKKFPYRNLSMERSDKTKQKPFDLMVNDGFPDQRIAPFNSILNQYKTLADRTYLHSALLTGNISGSMTLRIELAEFLSKTRALDIGPENILVTHGAQSAIHLAASMILLPGSAVIVADLNYPLADRLFEQLGARLIKVDVDENGIDVDAIESACKNLKPDLLYIIPHHHHPTTVTLSAERRMRLLEIIREYQLPVIEDDYDYDFHYNNSPILPLASAEHNGYVLYIGSISKTLAPTIRSGYLVGSEDFIWQTSKMKQLLEIRGDVLFEESIAHLFRSGEMQKHIRRSVKLYKERRESFCEQLEHVVGDISNYIKPQGGMAFWATFDRDYSLVKLADRMLTKGIRLNGGCHYPYHPDVNGLRLGFASMNEPEMSHFFEVWKSVK